MDYQFIKEASGMIGLLFFVVTFTGILIWVFKPSSKERFEEDANIPFKGDD